MKIISHRGLWNEPSEKNSLSSFKNSIDQNFGFEIDIRSFNGELIVSHDPLDDKNKSIRFCDVLSYYQINNSEVFIAINIKEDGLDFLIKKILTKFDIENYFVFDMSIPDMVIYSNSNITFFTRQSEYEKHPALYEKASGIWLDEFDSHWINDEIIQFHHNNNKKICIVSPELHDRDFTDEWKKYKKILSSKTNFTNIMICTDYSEKAKKFFS